MLSTDDMLTLTKEAVVTGLVLTVLYMIMDYVYTVYSEKQTFEFKPLKKEYVFVYFAGMVGHFALQASGVNKWYCDNGLACKVEKFDPSKNHPATASGFRR